MTTLEFFDSVDGDGVMERDLDRIFAMEMLQAKRFQEIYRQVLKDLDFKIAGLHGSGTITEAQAKILKQQLEDLMNAYERRKMQQMKGTLQMGIDQAAEDTEREINHFERKFLGIRQRLPVDSIVLSLNSENYLINRFASSLETWDSELRALMERNLAESILKRSTYEQAKTEIVREMRSVQVWKVARIVRTEMAHIYNASKITAFRKTKEAYIPQLKKGLIHPQDHRTAEDSKVLADQNPIIEIDKPFKFEWRGDKREFMAPPDRPNDRSILIPINPQWLQSNKK